MFYLQILIILLSSSFTGILVYYEVPISYLQQLAALILVITIVYVGRVLSKKEGIVEQKKILPMIFLTASLSQVVVLSTGGFYSPLLILVHLYTISSGFLINISTSIVFLVSTVLVLGGQLYWNENLRLQFQQDPGIVAIYLTSFVIIVPLAQYAMKTYGMKEKMSKLFGEYLHLGRQREKSILSGLNELIVITDQDLNIISVNEAAEDLLNISSSEVNKKKLFEAIPVYNSEKLPASIKDLPIDSIIKDRAIRIVKGMFLTLPTGQKLPVVIQIKPIQSSQDKVNQLVFIFTDSKLFVGKDERHDDLQQVITKYQTNLTQLRTALSTVNAPEVKKMVEIMSHIEEDMRIALEMEDHPIKENISLEDIAYISEQAVDSKQELTKTLGVNLQFILPSEEVSEEYWLKLKKQMGSKMLDKSDFTAPVDGAWLKLLVQKLLDISILLSTGSTTPKVEVVAQRNETHLFIEVVSYTDKVKSIQVNDLFVKDYGELNQTTNLRYGSGVEGFIAKAISTELNLPFTTQIVEKPPRLIFTIPILIKARS